MQSSQAKTPGADAVRERERGRVSSPPRRARLYRPGRPPWRCVGVVPPAGLYWQEDSRLPRPARHARRAHRVRAGRPARLCRVEVLRARRAGPACRSSRGSTGSPTGGPPRPGARRQASRPHFRPPPPRRRSPPGPPPQPPPRPPGPPRSPPRSTAGRSRAGPGRGRPGLTSPECRPD